jgi:cytochrome c553
MLRNGLLAALLCSLSFGAAAAVEGLPLAGQKKALPCQACHGADGDKTVDPQYPRLAGQYADYLAKSLRDYQTGSRKNAIMAGFAATLSEQDIADLAAFYASQSGALEDLSHLK